jgi:cation:H+ antiporter
LVTSIPEVVVTFAAARQGAFDMAVANVLGSNLFNMVVLAVDDLLFLRGPILSHVAPELAVSAFSGVVMSGIVVTGLVYRPVNRAFGTVGWVSLALVCMYVLNTYAAFLHG